MFNLKALLKIIFVFSLAAAISACSEERASDETGVHEDAYDITAGRAKVARIEMNVDTSFLTGEERQVINLLNRVGDLMSEIYLRQVSEGSVDSKYGCAKVS